MRRIERTAQFKRDYKRECRRLGPAVVDAMLIEVLESLVSNRLLSDRYRDHALLGEWHDYRDCHIRPDLILIDRKFDEEVLQLVGLGSHSELGL